MSEHSKRRRRSNTASSKVVASIEVQPEQPVVPYDESLIERVRTQWQFGDWHSLAKLDRETIQHHPDRAKLAVLAAAGRLHVEEISLARQYIRLALDWGISKKFVCQMLAAGVHNNLGRIAAIGNQHHQALRHFEAAISTGTPGSDTKLLAQARIGRQISQLGLDMVGSSPQVNPGDMVLPMIQTSVIVPAAEALSLDEIHQAWRVGRWDFLVKLDNAELAGRPNRSEIILYAACGYQQLDDMEGLHRCTRLARNWGCPPDKLKQYLTAGIHNTLALCDALDGQFASAAKNFSAALTIGSGKPKQQIVMNRIRRQLNTLKNFDTEQTAGKIANYLE